MGGVGRDERDLIDQVADWLHEARSVVHLTGAGISTESGIPDFRGPNGVWTKNPSAERAATLQNYLASRENRVSAWKRRLSGGGMQAAEPNSGHVALTELHALGKASTLVTQNIDGLHQAAGFPQRDIVEIHGTVHDYRCLGCGDSGPIEVVLQRVEAGEEDPECRLCGGILKTATISFGQNLVPEDIDRAQRAAASCDMFMAIGTSLTVYPVAALPEMALRRGARFVIINAQETPYDSAADAIIRGQIGRALPAIVEGLRSRTTADR